MSFINDTVANAKEELRSKIEDNTGIVGQTLRTRREKEIKQKEVAEKVSAIKKETLAHKTSSRLIFKIEAGLTSISTNLQGINKWADAYAVTQEETDAVLTESKKQAQVKTEQLATKVEDASKEEEKGFSGILDVLDKWKTTSKQGKRGPKKTRGMGKYGKVLGGLAVLGGGYAALKSVKQTVEKPPQPVDYSVKPSVTEPPKEAAQQFPTEQRAPIVTAPPAPLPPPPSFPQQERAVAPPVQQQAPPVAQVPPAPPPLEVTKVQPTSKPASVAKDLGPPPSTQTSGPSPALSSVVKLADSGVSLAGMNPTFENKVATMASAFKQQTGKTLLVTSGIRSNEKQKELYDAKVAQLGGNTAAAKKLVAEPMPPLGSGKGSMHLKGLAIDMNSKGDAGINTLAGTRDAPTGWLEKFGLTRPVPKEDWHIQLASTPPAGDVGGVPNKDGKPVDPNTGKPLPVPTDPTTGQSLLNNSKTVDQLKKENAQPGQTTIVVQNTTTKTVWDKKAA